MNAQAAWQYVNEHPGCTLAEITQAAAFYPKSLAESLCLLQSAGVLVGLDDDNRFYPFAFVAGGWNTQDVTGRAVTSQEVTWDDAAILTVCKRLSLADKPLSLRLILQELRADGYKVSAKSWDELTQDRKRIVTRTRAFREARLFMAWAGGRA